MSKKKHIITSIQMFPPAPCQIFPSTAPPKSLIAPRLFAARDVVEQLSALGLRHVGYRIPTDLVPPFVVAATEDGGFGEQSRGGSISWRIHRPVGVDGILG